MQSVFSWAPKVARKYDRKHWYACGADGRSVVRSVYGHLITKFSGMSKFTYPWCSAGALRARASELRYNGVGALRGQRIYPAKINPSTPPPEHNLFLALLCDRSSYSYFFNRRSEKPGSSYLRETLIRYGGIHLLIWRKVYGTKLVCRKTVTRHLLDTYVLPNK